MRTRKLSIFAVVASLVLATLAGCSKKNEPVGTVTDACGNQYNYVKIGNQYWLAENMRCNRYDTQSERAGETISTSDESVYTPYYTDASDKAKWSAPQFTGALSSEQIAKSGYLYNWAGAVGLITEKGVLEKIDAFSGNRQGICPNGWHVPTSVEWSELKTYIENRDGKGKNTAGKHLKTASGWYSSNKSDDIYSFAAIPSGRSECSAIDAVGLEADYWTASPCVVTIVDVTDPDTGVKTQTDPESDYFYMSNSSDLLYSIHQSKTFAKSVRCVRN
ncbi:MAG: hypothetical protein II708_03730 [Paludibacteraceae bacterium]|nr:hypothetical protein [Paludibacteraceae bacterium]